MARSPATLDKLKKAFAMALHPRTSEKEQQAAACGIIRLMRSDGWTLDDLINLVPDATIDALVDFVIEQRQPTPPATKHADRSRSYKPQPRPQPRSQEKANDPRSVIKTWGKHNGKSVGWIADHDPDHLRWLAQESNYDQRVTWAARELYKQQTVEMGED